MKTRTGFWLWLLVILLTAVCLRLYQLNTIPPGFTHDEADHGITAVSILNGAREIYFTIGYGREPLFDYATAGAMLLFGQKGWVLRGTAVFFGLLLIAGTTAWTRLAFNNRVALLAAAGLAVGFWPIMAARQSLRSITLSALFPLALTFLWLGLQKVETDRRASIFDFRSLVLFLLAGMLLGLTLYTYIPARGLWLLFPALWLLGSLWDRFWLRQTWFGTALMLLMAALVVWPLVAFLQANPAVEVRINELSVPLAAAVQGDFDLLWANVRGGLGIFTVIGDTAWRYNIPGRPILGPVMGTLFYMGIALSVVRVARGREIKRGAGTNGRLAYAAVLIWLLGGVAPVLITGPELSMTQGMGMQPVVYILIALAIERVWQLVQNQLPLPGSRRQLVGLVGATILFGGTAIITARDYFGTWANAPEVRVQYESTMTTILNYLAAQEVADTAVSTITPGPFHTSALAQMILPEDVAEPRWFDGRSSLIMPDADEALVVFSGFAPLPKALVPYLEAAALQETLTLRPTDADRPVWIYRLTADKIATQWQSRLVPQAARFGEAAELIGYELTAASATAGETVQLVSAWRVQTPLPDLRLFTHLSGPDGVPWAQADRLDAPSGGWVEGDWLLQLHELIIPPETAAGHYPLVIGLYTCLDPACTQTQRLTVWQDGTAVGDSLQLTELGISE